MKKLLLALAFLLLAVQAQAGSIEIFTDLDFAITNPPGATVTGFTLAYNTTNIQDLTLISGPVTSFSTDGVNTVTAGFTPRSAASFRWSFLTSDVFPIQKLDFDFTGQSAPINGGLVDIRVVPIPEPATVILLGSGVLGCVLLRRKIR